jgi:arylsulfatase A-like enzyme
MEPVIGTTPGLPPWETTVSSPLGPAQLGPVYAAWLERKRPGAYEEIYAQRRRPEYREGAQAIVNVLAPDEYVDYWIGENTWRYLERPDTGGEERPFFLWCGFCGPHGPFDPPEPYASLYDQATLPLSPTLHARQLHAPPPLGGPRQSRFDGADGPALARKITAYYWGMVTFVDDMVGRIMEVLTRRDLWDCTLVIFTTDHGEMLGDFGRLGKENFTEAVTRVPYLVVPPGAPRDPGGPRFVDSLVEHVDLVPTILDYAGLEQPLALPGLSLRPILESPPGGPHPRTRDSVLCEYVTPDRTQRLKCLRSTRYKYVFGGPQDAPAAAPPVQLFDLERDPLELENVAPDPAYRDELQRHAEMLLHRLSWSEHSPWNTGGAARYAGDTLDHFGRPG